jgi:hypothetical protein
VLTPASILVKDAIEDGESRSIRSSNIQRGRSAGWSDW